MIVFYLPAVWTIDGKQHMVKRQGKSITSASLSILFLALFLLFFTQKNYRLQTGFARLRPNPNQHC